MGEVSKLTGLAPHMLRNWEKSFPELRPKKNSAGNRAYKEHEVELIFRIKSLLIDKKYTTEGVQNILKTEKDSPQQTRLKEVPAAVKKDLTEIKMFMLDLLEKL